MAEQEKREKVIKGLECCTKYPNEYGDCLGGDCQYGPRIECHKELIQDALTLLKAHASVKPMLKNGWYWCGGIGCRHSLTSVIGNDVPALKPNYCEKCGRAVKWE